MCKVEFVAILIIITLIYTGLADLAYKQGYTDGLSKPRAPTFREEVFHENELWQLRFQKRHCK